MIALARWAAGALILATLTLLALTPVAHGQATNQLYLSVSQSSFSESAGTSTTVTVTVATSSTSSTFSKPSTVTVSVGGGGDKPATAGTDFAAVADFTITLPEDTHSATGTFTFTPTSDEIVEGDETVVVSGTATIDLQNVTFAVNSATITIVDDDQSTVFTADASAVAGNPVDFTISLTKALSVDVDVNLSTFETGSASAPADFEAQTGITGTVTAGQTSTTISVPTVADNDTVVEASKSFGAIINFVVPAGFTLSNVALSSSDADATGTILDDDTRSAAPTGLTATTQQSTGDDITLRWNAPGDTGLLNGAAAAITGYQFRRAATSAGLSSATWTATGGTGTTYTIGSPTADDVFFQVRAVTGVTDQDGNPAPSAASNQAEKASASAPGRVTDLSVSLSGNTATLSWTVPSDGGLAFSALNVSVDTGSDFFLPSADQVDNPSHTVGATQTKTLAGTYDSLTKFRIRYANAIGMADYSNVVMAGPDAPAAPTKASPGFNRGAGYSGLTLLDWSAPSNTGSGPITGYDIQWRQGTSGTWNTVNVGTANPSAEQRTVNHGSTQGQISLHQFRVRASNAAGVGVWSEILEVAGRPGNLTNLAASNPMPDRVTLTWTAPTTTGGKTITYLCQAQEPGASHWRFSKTVSGTTCDVTGLSHETTYAFRARAQNADRDGWFLGNDDSVTATTTTDPAATPGPVRNLAHTLAGLSAEQRTSRLKFSWDAPNTGGDFGWYAYDIALAGSGSPFSSGGSSDSTEATFSDLHPGTSYDVRVRACKSNAQTDCSAWMSASGTTDAIAPDPPRNLTASALNNDNDGTDRLTWVVPENTGVDGYRVQRRQAGQTSWEAAVTVTGTTYDWAKASGTSGSAYDYRVEGYNETDASGYTAHVTVAGRPGGISDLSATASTGAVAVNLSWTAPANGGKALTGYRIEWREDASGDWSANPATGNTTAPGSATSFSVSSGHGLQTGTVYDFRIRADNPDRSSFYSNTAQADQATANFGATVSATNPSPLTEGGLNGATLTVDLVGRDYVSDISSPGRRIGFGINVVGVTVSSVNRVSDTRATVTLAFTGDFANDLNLVLTVANELHSGSELLTAPPVPVTAEAAPPQVTGVTADGGASRVTVTWTALSDADGYKVQWHGPGESYDPARLS